MARTPGTRTTREFIDLVCVGIEVALVVLATVWLMRPELGRDWRGGRLALFAVAPIAVLALATAALASPSARNHAHDTHGEHAEAVAAGSVANDGHAHATTATPVEVVDLNGKHVHGVKAQDVAAELQPDQPLDPATARC